METEKQGRQSTEETETFYEQLPRFVEGVTVETADVKLHPIQRTAYLGGRKFEFMILPARFTVKVGKNGEINQQCRFPGDFEEFLESVLRALSVPENHNFDRANSVLWCSREQLIAWMIDFEDENGKKPDLTGNRIDIAVSTLANVEYILRRGTSEYYFCPIKHLRQTELDGNIYYRFAFTPFFFDDRDELFERLFAEQND